MPPKRAYSSRNTNSSKPKKHKQTALNEQTTLNEQSTQIELNESCLLNVPLQNYGNDFTFIVNETEFKTSFIVSDLISPKICKMHTIDPTINTFIITTKHQGDFSQIINLTKFTALSVNKAEIPFIIEVVEALEIKSINMKDLFSEEKICEENVFDLLTEHLKYNFAYRYQIEKEINFISSHFFDLCKNNFNELKSLEFDILLEIISNDNLKLINEDQLLQFINQLYIDNENQEISLLYNFIQFKNLDQKSIESFIEIFDYNDISKEIWDNLSNRLIQPIKESNDDFNSSRYKTKSLTFSQQNDQVFNGIINYLKNESHGNIGNKIKITTSSFDSRHPPINVTLFDNNDKYFRTKNKGLNNFICFDFKNAKINPTYYQLKSSNNIEIESDEDYDEELYDNSLITWKVEGSNDKSNWVKIDEQSSCHFYRNNGSCKLFKINQEVKNDYRYIRICNTGVDSSGEKFLRIDSVEFYGNLNVYE